ncbi:condensation domain-containing protein [Streptomyces sp. NPDC059578]|uniref:condensation domain-containing protein n=1 Tax=unclassified Streptomyces TaxID=2593676 RepID=UPI00365F26E2
MIPLSFVQQRLWFLDQLAGPQPTYNVPLTLRLSGDLEEAALEAALGDVVARHESLRTVFPEVGGEPYQHVLDSGDARPRLRVREVAPDNAEAVLRQEARHAFDISSEPPVRATIVRFGPGEHILLLLIHHIAIDDWSFTPLCRDLSEAYTARRLGSPPRWEALPVQYADYAMWQREALGDRHDPDSELAAHVDYWRQELAGSPELLELPTDRVRPPAASGLGRSVSFGWDERTQGALVALAKATGTTVFMGVQAAVAALLSRLGSGDDIPVGAAFSGRTDEALDDLVGFFTNTLVLRTDTSGNPTFRELVLRVREKNLAAHAHQEMPFDLLVEVLRPARSLGHHSLFQVMLAYENAGSFDFDMPGLDVSVLQTDTEVVKFDLSLTFSEEQVSPGGPDRMTGTLHYASDLFDRGTAESIAERLERFVSAVAADPDRPIEAVEVLSQEERHRLLVEWNDLQEHLDVLWASRRTNRLPCVGPLSHVPKRI